MVCKVGTNLVAIVIPARTVSSCEVSARPDLGTVALETALVVLVGTDTYNHTMCHFIRIDLASLPK